MKNWRRWEFNLPSLRKKKDWRIKNMKIEKYLENEKEMYRLIMNKEEYSKMTENSNKYSMENYPENTELYDEREIGLFLIECEDNIIITTDDIFENNGGLIFEEDFWDFIREFITEEDDEKETFIKEIKY